MATNSETHVDVAETVCGEEDIRVLLPTDRRHKVVCLERRIIALGVENGKIK
jgi:hypothetical protein